MITRVYNAGEVYLLPRRSTCAVYSKLLPNPIRKTKAPWAVFVLTLTNVPEYYFNSGFVLTQNMMSYTRRRQALAAILALCILFVGGLASAQAITHESHHAHHQKATHDTVLCSWMCAAGQGWEGEVVQTLFELFPLEWIELASLGHTPIIHVASPATRGPPAS